MLYWNEIINDLAKIHGFVVLSLYGEVTNFLRVGLLSHNIYQFLIPAHIKAFSTTVAAIVA
jgi:hypothetical protein